MLIEKQDCPYWRAGECRACTDECRYSVESVSMSTKLPSVLQHPRGSISMERALKQIKDLLETEIDTEGFPETEDRVNASIDDIETMLSCIDRG